MESLAALSLAGTIIQFVDFSSKIFSKSRELYESSSHALTVNEEIARAVVELDTLTAKLQHPPNQISNGTGNEHTLGTRQVSIDPALNGLCITCQKIAKELQGRLNVLKGQGKHQRWESFRQAIKGVWAEKDIQALMKRLSVLREALEMHILVNIRLVLPMPVIELKLTFVPRESFEAESAKSSDRFDQLDKQTRAIIDALVDIQATVAENIQDQTVMTQILHNTNDIMRGQRVAYQTNRSRTLILDTFEKAAPFSAEERIAVSKQDSAIAQKEWQDAEDQNLSAAAGILSDLNFAAREARRVAITSAHHQTFDWIFQDTSPAGPEMLPWSNFNEWLRKGNGVYWINGKAGSGKSTLMRYIYEKPETRRRLENWALDTPLCIAGFFFWNSGSAEQRSQTGLLRTLLYEILKDHQELIPTVFPAVWAQRCVRGIRHLSEDRRHRVDDLPYPVLLAALGVLVSTKIIPLKICFFIDGLDEFGGDHTELAELFLSMASNRNIKVCLSSRPLLALHDAFSGSPGLRLQDLTVRDIRNYITDKLGGNLFYKRLERKDPDRATALTTELGEKASGVFLWVVLVVKSLLDGLKARDGILDLRRRLAELPADLETLYQQMMVSGIASFYQRKASEVFQILRAAREIQRLEENTKSSRFTTYRHDEGEPLSCLGFSFTNEEDSELAIRAELRPLTPHEKIERYAITQDRLRIWCAGLVEVQDMTQTVQYLHRTVRDYVEREDIWESLILKTADSDFEPDISLLQSCVLQIKVLRSGHTSRTIASTAMRHAFRSNSSKRRDYAALLDELDRAMRHRVRGFQGSLWFHDLPSPNEKRTFQAKVDDQDTFVSYAIQHGLFDYLQESLCQNSNLSPAKTGRPLLDYAIDAPMNTEILTILLRSGASPNEFFRGMTVWERLLCAIYNDSTELHTSLASCILFAKHGANPDAICSVNPSSRQLSAGTMIFILFHEKFPRETDELLQLLGNEQTHASTYHAQHAFERPRLQPAVNDIEIGSVDGNETRQIKRPQRQLSHDGRSYSTKNDGSRRPDEETQHSYKRQGGIFEIEAFEGHLPKGPNQTTHSRLPVLEDVSTERDRRSSLRKKFMDYFRPKPV